MEKNMQFYEDLKKAHTTEKVVCDFISSSNDAYQVDMVYDGTNKGRDPGYDIIVTNTETKNVSRIEVKDDLMSAKTGNICMEIKSRGKFSGLSTNKADYWIIVDYCSVCFLLIPTEELRYMCFSRKYRVVRGGDNGTSECLLIPSRDLEEYRQKRSYRFVQSLPNPYRKS